jgi:nucleoside-diphosphate-sugar epimerase
VENKRLKIAVTGASGFVGRRFLEYNKDRYDLLPLSLRDRKIIDIDLSGVDCIVHLAGKAHQMQPIADEVYYEVNYSLTKELAEKAKAQAVPHFVYISSTKVYGDHITEKLNEKSPCNPSDPYGKSKYQAEELLRYMSTELFKVAVVRPPLVYGAGVKGNMLRLLDLSARNYPLPFGKSRNLRSMVFIDNLVELINRIIDQQAAGTFIAGDNKPIPTDELISMIRKNMGRKEDLITIPGILRGLLKVVTPAMHTRLFGSFVVDNSTTNKILNFTPPFSTEDGISKTVQWYLTAENKRTVK